MPLILKYTRHCSPFWSAGSSIPTRMCKQIQILLSFFLSSRQRLSLTWTAICCWKQRNKEWTTSYVCYILQIDKVNNICLLLDYFVPVVDSFFSKFAFIKNCFLFILLSNIGRYTRNLITPWLTNILS